VVCIQQIINIFSVFALHITYTKEFINIIAGTNPEEASEFFATYLNAKAVVLILSTIALLMLLIFLLKRFIPHSCRLYHLIKFRISLISLLLISVPLVIRYADTFSYFQSPIGLIKSFSGYDKVTAIKPTNPSLNVSEEADIPTIVVVIGESHSKMHSSIYGYTQDTNPRLAAMPDSLLHIFKNVESADLHTIGAFRRFMTTADNNDVDCYNTPNIIEIAKKAGYYTTWISNQSKAGIYDNKITIFANLCDSVVWNGNCLTGLNKCETDDQLLPIIKRYNSPARKNMIFIHLMGSHFDFKSRYTDNFDKFKPTDYHDIPANQREITAEYDNSILFNDYIVSSLFNIFSDRDAVMLYFSDHGMDIFYTEADYFGHAIASNDKSAHFSSQIPFVIYTSSKFNRNHADLKDMIERSTNIHFNTNDLPYMLMQIMNVTFQDKPNKYPLTK
jgi:heptose-I-phosphate ethanolaminephosphotransferase